MEKVKFEDLAKCGQTVQRSEVIDKSEKTRIQPEKRKVIDTETNKDTHKKTDRQEKKECLQKNSLIYEVII